MYGMEEGGLLFDCMKDGGLAFNANSSLAVQSSFESSLRTKMCHYI